MTRSRPRRAVASTPQRSPADVNPELDELVRRAAAQEGETVSQFLRRAAADRVQRTLERRDQLQDVIGAIRTPGGVARQTGTAFAEMLRHGVRGQ